VKRQLSNTAPPKIFELELSDGCVNDRFVVWKGMNAIPTQGCGVA
jgi:hypothetical protein